MRLYLMALICIGISGMLGYAAGTIEVRRSPDEWVCSDREPDGCAEWRREHYHEMPGSARR